jgi:hypothetical protein
MLIGFEGKGSSAAQVEGQPNGINECVSNRARIPVYNFPLLTILPSSPHQKYYVLFPAEEYIKKQEADKGIFSALFEEREIRSGDHIRIRDWPLLGGKGSKNRWISSREYGIAMAEIA